MWSHSTSITGSYGRQASWLAGWLAGWPADKIALNLKKLKLYNGLNIRIFAMFNKGTVLL